MPQRWRRGFWFFGHPFLRVHVDEQAAERAGAALVGALACAVAYSFDAIAGRQVLGRAQRGDDGGARGRYEFAGDWCRREGDIARLAQVDDSGDGNGHEAVGAANGSVALGERLDNDVLNTQVIEADGDRADVDDGVDGAYLVKHDGLGRFAVGFSLGGGERGKDGERATLGAIAQLRAVDDLGDIG